MPTNTKKVIIFMLTSALLLSPSTEAQESPVKNEPVYGGTLNIGTSNPPAIINPILTQHSVSRVIMDFVFDSLVRTNSEGKIEPGLSKLWKMSANGLEYTFYLKKGIYFHDGAELTADDVVFTYEAYSDPKNKSPFLSKFESVESLKAIDRYTIKITLKRLNPQFIHEFVAEVVPKHILENEDLERTTFNYHPIGTGPFQFKSWDQNNDEIELVANDNYYDGRPYLDKIKIKVFADNSQLWAAFMRQEVDLIKFIKWEDYKLLKKDETFRTHKIPWEAYYAVTYNLSDPILSDIHVRRAIAHAINKKEIIRAVLGEGTESVGPFHPGSIGFNRSIKPYEYDPYLAKEILRKRGWIDRNGDGLLEKNRRDFSIKVLVDGMNRIDRQIISYIRQQLSEVGIRLTVLLYNDEKELTEEYIGKNRPQAWLRLFIGVGPGLDNHEAMANWYSTSTEFAKLWNYKNRKIDGLYQKVQTVKAEDRRAEIFKKIHKIIHEDQPVTFLFYPMSFHAVSSKIHNTDDYFSISMPRYTIKNWYIKTHSEF